MKKLSKFLVIIAVMAVMVSLAGCITASSIGGTSDPQGLISKGQVVAEGRTEIASYSVYVGFFTSGYEEYAAAVMAADAAGKQITTITKWFFVFTTTTAYSN
jgi:predicted small secreted protein